MEMKRIWINTKAKVSFYCVYPICMMILKSLEVSEEHGAVGYAACLAIPPIFTYVLLAGCLQDPLAQASASFHSPTWLGTSMVRSISSPFLLSGSTSSTVCSLEPERRPSKVVLVPGSMDCALHHLYLMGSLAYITDTAEQSWCGIRSHSHSILNGKKIALQFKDTRRY